MARKKGHTITIERGTGSRMKDCPLQLQDFAIEVQFQANKIGKELPKGLSVYVSGETTKDELVLWVNDHFKQKKSRKHSEKAVNIALKANKEIKKIGENRYAVKPKMKESETLTN